MSTKTTNYELVMPALTDAADITAMNPNWTKIDTELKKRATLDDTGKVPTSQLPAMDYIPTSEKGQPGGVPVLDENGKLPAEVTGNIEVTGAASTIMENNLTANRAVISNANGKVAVSPVTSTELGQLSGVTSNVQTQLGNKLSTSGGNVTGSIHFTNSDGTRAISKVRTVGGVSYYMDVGMGVYGGKGTAYMRLLQGSDSNGTQLYRLDLTPYGMKLQNSAGNVFWLGGSPVATASVES